MTKISTKSLPFSLFLSLSLPHNIDSLYVWTSLFRTNSLFMTVNVSLWMYRSFSLTRHLSLYLSLSHGQVQMLTKTDLIFLCLFPILFLIFNLFYWTAVFWWRQDMHSLSYNLIIQYYMVSVWVFIGGVLSNSLHRKSLIKALDFIWFYTARKPYSGRNTLIFSLFWLVKLQINSGYQKFTSRTFTAQILFHANLWKLLGNIYKSSRQIYF